MKPVVIRQTSKWVKVVGWTFLAFLGLNICLAAINYVSSTVTESDEAVFRSILNLHQPNGSLTYAQEVELISKVQHRMRAAVAVGDAIPNYQNREPEDLLKQGTGLCYDRSRTLDKVFSWLGFRTRHVFILYSEDPTTGIRLSFVGAFLRPGMASHAVTEVKTSRGWMLVDSNSEWISVTKDGDPIDADHIRGAASQFTRVPAYFVGSPYWAIRGMYSRRGQFYWPFLVPYPQLNWVDFLSWIVFD